MIKRLLLLLILSAIGEHKLNAQIIQLGGTQYLNRLQYSYLEGTQLGDIYVLPVYRSFNRSSQGITLDVLIYKGLYMNIEYLSQYTVTGFAVTRPNGAGGGSAHGSLWHAQIPLRLKYKYDILEKWNRKLWISTSLGIALNINRGVGDPWLGNGGSYGGSLDAGQGHTLYYFYRMNSTINRTFLLYRGELEVGVDLFPWLSAFFRIGGSIGTEKQVEHDVIYWFEDTDRMYATVYNEGDSWFYGIGLYAKLYPQVDNWKALLKP